MKRLLALILCLVMCLSLVPAAGAEGDAPNTTDTTAPTVSNITLSATTVNAPGSLTVSVTATDNLSGVSSIQVEFYNKETESYLYAHPQLESSGLFAGTLNIGQYTNAGKYVIRSVYITDKAGNSKWYYGEGAKQASEESKLPAKCYSLAFDVVDPEAFPSITTQPQSKTAATGATVKFTVKASNATGYQWYFRKSASDSWSKCSNASSSSLSVEALSYRSGYQYRCKVSNDVGSVYSNAATLTVMNPPSVTTQPQNKTVSVGASASFTVKASGSSLSYQWQFRKSASDSWSNCSNGTSATFSVEAKTYRDGYQYRCKVSNAVGTVYSSAATLRVKPAITTQPKAATVPVGSRASFTVKAEGATSYQWQFRKSADAGWSSCSDGTGAAGDERGGVGVFQRGDPARHARDHDAADVSNHPREQQRELYGEGRGRDKLSVAVPQERDAAAVRDRFRGRDRKLHGDNRGRDKLPVAVPQARQRGLEQLQQRHKRDADRRGEALPQRIPVPLPCEKRRGHDDLRSRIPVGELSVRPGFLRYIRI